MQLSFAQQLIAYSAKLADHENHTTEVDRTNNYDAILRNGTTGVMTV